MVFEQINSSHGTEKPPAHPRKMRLPGGEEIIPSEAELRVANVGFDNKEQLSETTKQALMTEYALRGIVDKLYGNTQELKNTWDKAREIWQKSVIDTLQNKQSERLSEERWDMIGPMAMLAFEAFRRTPIEERQQQSGEPNEEANIENFSDKARRKEARELVVTLMQRYKSTLRPDRLLDARHTAECVGDLGKQISDLAGKRSGQLDLIGIELDTISHAKEWDDIRRLRALDKSIEDLSGFLATSAQENVENGVYDTDDLREKREMSAKVLPILKTVLTARGVLSKKIFKTEKSSDEVLALDVARDALRNNDEATK